MVKKVVNYLVINLSCFRSFFTPKNGLNPTITVRKRAKHPYTSRNQCANMLIFSLSHNFFYIFFYISTNYIIKQVCKLHIFML